MTHFYHAQNFGFETASVEPERGRFSGGGYHTAFFDSKRNGIHIAVDQKIRSNAKGQIIITDGIFDEFIVQTLHFRKVVPISLEHIQTVARIFGVMGDQPFYFGFFTKFAESFYRRRLVFFHDLSDR